MDLVVLSPVSVGLVHVRGAGTTLVAKATFDVVEGGALVPRATPEPIAPEDEPHPEGAPDELARASDLLASKPRLDVLLLGHAHAPRPTTLHRVELAVGRLRRSFVAISRAPRAAFPLVRAFLRRSEEDLEPISVGPLASRGSRSGVAPDEQQIGGVAPDAELHLGGLLPGVPVFAGRLPGLRPTAVALRSGGAPELLPLVCDTLVVDVDAARVSLVWRGPVGPEESVARVAIALGLADHPPGIGELLAAASGARAIHASEVASVRLGDARPAPLAGAPRAAPTFGAPPRAPTFGAASVGPAAHEAGSSVPETAPPREPSTLPPPPPPRPPQETMLDAPEPATLPPPAPGGLPFRGAPLPAPPALPFAAPPPSVREPPPPSFVAPEAPVARHASPPLVAPAVVAPPLVGPEVAAPPPPVAPAAFARTEPPPAPLVSPAGPAPDALPASFRLAPPPAELDALAAERPSPAAPPDAGAPAPPASSPPLASPDAASTPASGEDPELERYAEIRVVAEAATSRSAGRRARRAFAPELADDEAWDRLHRRMVRRARLDPTFERALSGALARARRALAQGALRTAAAPTSMAAQSRTPSHRSREPAPITPSSGRGESS